MKSESSTEIMQQDGVTTTTALTPAQADAQVADEINRGFATLPQHINVTDEGIVEPHVEPLPPSEDSLAAELPSTAQIEADREVAEELSEHTDQLRQESDAVLQQWQTGAGVVPKATLVDATPLSTDGPLSEKALYALDPEAFGNLKTADFMTFVDEYNKLQADESAEANRAQLLNGFITTNFATPKSMDELLNPSFLEALKDATAMDEADFAAAVQSAYETMAQKNVVGIEARRTAAAESRQALYAKYTSKQPPLAA